MHFTTVEVRFTPEGAGTLVELEHRDLELMGTNASKVRELLDSTKGWGAALGLYARLAEEVLALYLYVYPPRLARSRRWQPGADLNVDGVDQRD